ncbi:MAG: zinc-dependent alcohol dehydrogenase family protein [Ardenticatenaceae bacterium]|nr:zinc-dependent alcohol dehydrogenase family protein [Ardenticatenaceae bacterium]MCB9443095.1 zinc-dependent alcohol dehydrogenase family protein [Ardenticatenaceae bacterium]
MKAMQLSAARPIVENPLKVVETAVPQPGPNQILLRVTVCGVCHTDLQTVEGDLELPRLPITPGHQVVGVVAQLGSGNGRYQIGDRVGVAWLNWSCGQCGYCQRGLENLCPEARFTGLHAHGGYAEYMVVDERFAYPIPPQFSDAKAAPLLCAGVIGYRSLRVSGIQPGQTLGLYGFGASAHIVIQVARHWDCQVYVFTRSPEHQQHALKLGAGWVGQAQDEPPTLLDAGITFAPAGWLIPLALGHLRPGGTLALNSIHMSPIPEMPYNLLWGERVLRSVANVTRQDAAEFLQLAAQIPVKTEVELYPLDEANAVLHRLKASEIKGAAALVVN